MRQPPPLLRGTGGEHREVALGQRAVLYLLGQAGRALARLGEHHHAARGTVQTMHQPEVYVARLVVLLFQIRFEHPQHILVARLVRLAGYALRLDHHEQVIVFVKYLYVLIVHDRSQRSQTPVQPQGNDMPLSDVGNVSSYALTRPSGKDTRSMFSSTVG